MKYTLSVADTDRFFEKVEQSEMFTSKESISGLSVKYNGVFTVISNPKINLIKISNTEIKVDVIPNLIFTMISAVFTLFFWSLAATAIVMSKLNIAVIAAVFLLPSVIWLLHFVFNREIGRQVKVQLQKISE